MAEPVLPVFETQEVQACPFPARSKQTTGLVDGTKTDVASVYFADKILITISQGGHLSQWIEVPLHSASPDRLTGTAISEDLSDQMLPLSHLTPKTLLGGGSDQRETIGRLYAAQIATRIATRDPGESRAVVVGLGLEKVSLSRGVFFDLMELAFMAI
ncbi:hypothetical protein K3495_g5714 [Podosphaera aphanis]|nr:hypothetical protein K3495_g5714 [Podosphaera aphanis]